MELPNNLKTDTEQIINDGSTDKAEIIGKLVEGHIILDE